jgi:predicted GNAT family acetyltransferase
VTEVRDNPEKNRYELLEDGKLLGVSDYRAQGDKLALPHTEIVPARRNQGLGHQLVKGALDDVRRRGGLKVVPYCWFVAEFIQDNPEYADLRA